MYLPWSVFWFISLYAVLCFVFQVIPVRHLFSSCFILMSFPRCIVLSFLPLLFHPRPSVSTPDPSFLSPPSVYILQPILCSVLGHSFCHVLLVLCRFFDQSVSHSSLFSLLVLVLCYFLPVLLQQHFQFCLLKPQGPSASLHLLLPVVQHFGSKPQFNSNCDSGDFRPQ